MTRPRSERAHGQVLDAALKLFAARGVDGTSMDAIAGASGVSKATIYKHWPDKNALCLEVMAGLHGAHAEPPDVDSGDLRADLIAILSHKPPPRDDALRMRLMPHLMAYAARNPAFGLAWRARVLEPPRAQLTRVLARAVARGQLPRDTNIEVAIALLLGPRMYGHFLKLMNRHLPDHMPELIVDAFLKASSGVPRARGRSR
jgi:AcrR family transcriptional regulator